MKFQDLEENYIENLLKTIYGDYKLQGTLENMHISRSGKFEEKTYKSDLGGVFSLKLIGLSNIVRKTVIGDFINHIVLSIHLIIEEVESKGFLGFGKKVVRFITIKVIVNEGFFKQDKQSINDLRYSIQKFKPVIETESGMKVKEFVYSSEE